MCWNTCPSILKSQIFFYNPNISPREEYEKREEELERLIASMPFVHKPKFLKGVYCPEKFFEMARGMEDIPEGGVALLCLL